MTGVWSWAAAGFAVLAAALGLWLWTPDRPRAELEAAYARSPDDFETALGARLHVRDEGPADAPAVLMIHGFGSSLHTWDAWAAGLADRFRIVRFDLPGSGLSPPDPTDDYTDARSLELVRALMDSRGLSRAALVGNSIGGRIAWRFAAAYPDRVSGLVLVAPDGFASPGFDYDVAPEVSAAAEVMRVVLPKSLVKTNLAQSYGDPEALREAVVQRYYDLARAPGARAAMLARMRQTVLRDPAPELRRITAPVLLVWGGRDRLIPSSNAADYQAHLSDVRLALFDALGHVPQEEAPQMSLPPVAAFLEEIDAAASAAAPT